MINVDELVLRQQEQPQIHRSVQQAQAGVVHGSLFHHHLGSECFKRRLPKKLTEANNHLRLRCSKQLLIDAILIWF